MKDNSMTLKLWLFSPSVQSIEYMYQLYDSIPKLFDIANGSDIDEYLINLPHPIDADGTLHPSRIRLGIESMPVPRFRILTSDFRMNFLYMGLFYITENLARVLDFSDRIVQYINVDCSECPPEVRALGYRVMIPRVFANPLDQTFVPGVYQDVILPDGSLTQYWRQELPPAGPPVALRTRWREDFVPPAPMFEILGGPWLLVTDALAERVMRAGFDDVNFIDVTNDGTRSCSIHRTLSD
jgi:hypothetical protein